MKYEDARPYAPPLDYTQGLDEPIAIGTDPIVLRILEELANDPIFICGQLPIREKDAKPTSSERSSFRQFMRECATFLRKSKLIELSISVGIVVLAIYFFAQNPLAEVSLILVLVIVLYRFRPMFGAEVVDEVLPGGSYEWLVSEGGILVTTPNRSQWAIPWDQLGDIREKRVGWMIVGLKQFPTWRMPIDFVANESLFRLRSIAQFWPLLTLATRSHPAIYAELPPLSDQAIQYRGADWNLMTEASHARLVLKSLVASLTDAAVDMTANNEVVVVDRETGWQVKVPLDSPPAGP